MNQICSRQCHFPSSNFLFQFYANISFVSFSRYGLCKTLDSQNFVLIKKHHEKYHSANLSIISEFKKLFFYKFSKIRPPPQSTSLKRPQWESAFFQFQESFDTRRGMLLLSINQQFNALSTSIMDSLGIQMRRSQNFVVNRKLYSNCKLLLFPTLHFRTLSCEPYYK